ncbi:hypothetical protein ACL02R_15790 [Streptomyces sp. MS19]|uniref:hypothetical protein n=1 Tax=Streptomyces sp. MS19 TaxID=3385972 RepID=UPI0039A306B8
MTHWPHLTHAYGSAADIPALLDRITAERDALLWNDLWSALCHQGSVYPASFAALPWLSATAGGEDREQAVHALVLAGAIVAGAGGPVRTEYAAEITNLLAAAGACLATATDRAGYTGLLGAVLGLEGAAGWSEDLAAGLGDEEYEVPCPACDAGLSVVLGERGFFCADGWEALPGHEDTTRPLVPTAPEDLAGMGRRLYDMTLGDGQHEVARLLTHVFGRAVCPGCGTGFPVADRIGAG